MKRLMRWILAGTMFSIVGSMLASCSPSSPSPVAPQAHDDAFVVRSDGGLDVAGPGLLANDVAEEATLTKVQGTAANVGLPTSTDEGGVATVQANGAFVYTPAGGFTGSDTFSYGVSNAVGSDAANVSVFVTDPWTQLDPIPTAVSRPAGIFWGGRFYVVGGESVGGTWDGLVQVFDPATASWSVLPDTMPVPVSNLCAALVGDAVYVVGGYDGNATSVTTMQVFDLPTGTWSVQAGGALPEARSAHACAALGERIYLFGGSPNVSPGTATWLYEPSLPPGSRWVTTLAAMPAAAAFAAAVPVGDRIFVTGFGGPTSFSEDTALVLEYTPADDDWRSYPSLQIARAGAGAWSDGETLFVGGGLWYAPTTEVEAYDLSQGTAGTWVYSDPLLQARRTFAYAVDPATGDLYAAGGYGPGDFVAGAEVGRLLKRP